MAFDPTAYQQKYRWSGRDLYDRVVAFDIYVKTTTAQTLTYMGGVQGIHLELQGGQESIVAPVIKTNLRITLVDAPDIVEAGYKYGGWEEFFTPDSEAYYIRLSVDGVYVWYGFLTPDSWEESLDYHGSITITFRDNIGHLQDFEFDLDGNDDGLVNTRYLLESALDKVNFPMSKLTPGISALYAADSKRIFYNTFVAASAFSGKSWYDAFESVLDSLGYCFRWFISDKGYGVFLPIRDLPYRAWDDPDSALEDPIEVEFYGGTRTLDPAYKQITDKITFDHGDVSPDLFAGITFGTTLSSVSGNHYNPTSGQWTSFTAYYHTITGQSTSVAKGWTSGPGFLNPNQCTAQDTLIRADGEDALWQGVCLAADLANDTLLRSFGIPCFNTNVTVRVELGTPIELKSNSTMVVARLKDYIYSAVIRIRYVDRDRNTYYWTGSGWSTTFATRTILIAEEVSSSYEFEVILDDIADYFDAANGDLYIDFVNFHTRGTDNPDAGSFVRVKSITYSINSAEVLESDTVTTVNDADYNVAAVREAEFGALSRTVPWINPESYKNALWSYDADGAVIQFPYNVRWPGKAYYPLPLQIHRQILCYYHQPLSILEGDIGTADKSECINPSLMFTYKNKWFILQSGTWDVLRSRINGAMLREFILYNDLWND